MNYVRCPFAEKHANRIVATAKRAPSKQNKRQSKRSMTLKAGSAVTEIVSILRYKCLLCAMTKGIRVRLSFRALLQVLVQVPVLP